MTDKQKYISYIALVIIILLIFFVKEYLYPTEIINNNLDRKRDWNISRVYKLIFCDIFDK